MNSCVEAWSSDTDTASDDAIALILAVRDPLIDVRAVTVVAGNVPLELADRNEPNIRVGWEADEAAFKPPLLRSVQRLR